MKELNRAFFEACGRKGGAAGTGKSKVRGDQAYYKRIGKLSAKKRKLAQEVSA